MTTNFLDAAADRSLRWGRMLDAYDSYRKILDAVTAAENLHQQHSQMLGMIEEARLRFTEALAGLNRAKEFSLEDLFNSDDGGYQRYLLHIKKTIAGLEEVFLLHAARVLRPSQHPVSLLRRIRQLTATHPATAPPQFA